MQASVPFLFRDIDLVIFDLDGTLIDSSEDIAHSINYALGEVGLAKIPISQILQMIGHGSSNLVRKALAGREELFKVAFKAFGLHYSKNLLNQTKLYPGVLEVLAQLKGKKLAVLSNKRQEFCDPIIDGLSIRNYFSWVQGGDLLDEKKPSPKPVLHICKKFTVPPKQAVMVGDSSIDIEAGKAAGAWTVGLLKGFCPKEEVVGAKPHLLVENVASISSFLL